MALLFLSLLLLSSSPAAFSRLSSGGLGLTTSLKAAGTNPAVSKICKNTDHPQLCLSSIAPFLSSGHSVDVESVLRFAVEAGSKYAKEALSAANGFAAKTATPEVRSTLKDCKESYDTAVENFQKTLDAFATKDIGTMQSVLSAVITFVGDCEDEFTQMGTRSPLSKYAETLTEMTSNCLAIVSQMK
ncbi:Plant invertase/pectin methylesterase inhibitor superfamily protein [Striga hermonthica]|uniref:Plant invertase/pectin methylesterase inhibitor superfamily protein n=1 Tax=Striga hermonthica TaxID=68872 RepID=A0A9N7NHQ7_STRHE|nr:Plant invertase/pectin methylesterase inhibitor superfamily protein [Striga hermonthica]